MVEIIESNLTPIGEMKENVLCNCIIIDHSGEKYSDIYDLDEKHKQEGHPMFTHHYLIKKNGYIFRGRNEEYESYIDEKFNLNVIGIMVEGDFDSEYMNTIQFNNLIKLVVQIASNNSYIDNKIYIHSEINRNVTSPGRLFPFIDFKNRIIKNYISSATNFLNARNEVVYALGSRTLESTIPNTKGDDVYALKLKLMELGCSIKNLNNSFDEELENQVRLVQKKYGLDNNGIADSKFFDLVDKLTIKEMIDRTNEYQRFLKLEEPFISGSDVKLLKTKLSSLNYYQGERNEEYDELMKEAVEKFQEDNNIEITGTVGPLTFRTIMKSKDYSFRRVLELVDPIMEGPDVEIVQEMLYKKGYVVDITGFYDIKTHNAVCQYQLDNDYLIDGKVDLELFEQILS